MAIRALEKQASGLLSRLEGSRDPEAPLARALLLASATSGAHRGGSWVERNTFGRTGCEAATRALNEGTRGATTAHLLRAVAASYASVQANSTLPLLAEPLGLGPDADELLDQRLVAAVEMVEAVDHRLSVGGKRRQDK